LTGPILAKRWTRVLVLLAIFAGAVLARMVSLDILAERTPGFPIGFVDTLYHLRRVELVLQGNAVPPFDRYSTFPTGGDFDWPPLFDYLLAGASWVAGGGSPDRDVVHWTAAALAAIVGAMIVFPAYLVGCFVTARRGAGLLAAAAAAVFPFHVIYTAFGRPDHHGAETLLLGLCFYAFLRAEEAAIRSGATFRALVERGRRVPLGWAVACAASGVALLSVQTGAVLLLGIVSAYVLIRFLHGLAVRETREPILVAAFLAQGMAAPVLFLLTLLWGGHRRFEFVYNQPSVFQPTLYFLFAVFPLFLHALGRGLARLRLSGPAAIGAATAASVVAFLVAPLALSSGLLEAVRAASGWVAKEEIYLGTVRETQPLFFRDGELTLRPVWRYAGFAFPAGMLGLVALVASRVRRVRERGIGRAPGGGRGALFLALWTVSILVLAVQQLRFFNLVALQLCVLCGVLLAHVAAPRGGKVASALLALALLVPGGFLSWRVQHERYLTLEPFVGRACSWMRDRTPPAGNYMSPDRGARYGVMNNPAYGHHLVYLAARPAVSNPFFDLDGLARASRFFLATSEEEAVRAMDEARCRYAFLTMRCFDMHFFHPLLEDESRERWTREELTEARKIRLLGETPCAALYAFDGNREVDMVFGDETVRFDLLYDRFRLVYESAQELPSDSRLVPFRGESLPLVKVFERVVGASITGRAEPGVMVEVSIPVVVAGSGRRFEWVRSFVVPQDGRFGFHVPYACTEEEPGRIVVRGEGEPRAARVVVPEAAILAGGSLELSP